MGFFDSLFKQVIGSREPLQWNEETPGILAERLPIPKGFAQKNVTLVVRDTQLALLVKNGQFSDLFESGTHELQSLSSDIYFYSTREQIDQRWGTPTPIVIKDDALGSISIRSHGTFSFKIRNPKIFFTKISGNAETYTTSQLQGQLRSVILTQLAVVLGKSEVSFTDMAANQAEFSRILKEAVTEIFSSYGLSLESLYVQSLSLPETK